MFKKLDEAYIKTAKERGFRTPQHISMTSSPMEATVTENTKNTSFVGGFVARKEPDAVHINRLYLRTKNNYFQILEIQVLN